LEAIGKKIKALALGEESMPDEATQRRVRELAAEVREVARSAVDDAWKKLGEEFVVQKLVWDSKGISKRGKGAEEQALENKLQAVLQETMDPVGALARIDEILKSQNGRVSTSMLQTLQSIPRQTALIDKRKALADRLAASITSATPPQTQAEKDGLEKLVTSCRLAKSLDSRVREAVQLPPHRERSSSKERKDVNVDLAMKPMVIATPSRNLYECVGSTKASIRGELEPLPADAAANKLKSMASECPLASWTRLKSEFETQQLIWQSVAQNRKKDPAIAHSISSLKASFERILALHSESKEKALGAVRDLLGSTEDLKMLSNSVVSTCRDVIKQHELPPQRLKLAERVEVSSVAATLPKTDADKKEMETLVLACCLDDQLNYTVRKLLLLPIPQRLQSMEAESATLLRGLGALQKRSAMRTASQKASRRDSNKSVGAACEASGLGSVSAGARIIEQI